MLAPSKIYAVKTKAAPYPAIRCGHNVRPSDKTLRVLGGTVKIRIFCGPLFEFERVEDIQSHSVDHNAKQQHHTYHLGIFDEFIAGFTA